MPSSSTRLSAPPPPRTCNAPVPSRPACTPGTSASARSGRRRRPDAGRASRRPAGCGPARRRRARSLGQRKRRRGGHLEGTEAHRAGDQLDVHAGDRRPGDQHAQGQGVVAFADEAEPVGARRQAGEAVAAGGVGERGQAGRRRRSRHPRAGGRRWHRGSRRPRHRPAGRPRPRAVVRPEGWRRPAAGRGLEAAGRLRWRPGGARGSRLRNISGSGVGDAGRSPGWTGAAGPAQPRVDSGGAGRHLGSDGVTSSGRPPD